MATATKLHYYHHHHHQQGHHHHHQQRHATTIILAEPTPPPSSSPLPKFLISLSLSLSAHIWRTTSSYVSSIAKVNNLFLNQLQLLLFLPMLLFPFPSPFPLLFRGTLEATIQHILDMGGGSWD